MQLLIVDDHGVVREGIAALLTQAFGSGTRIFHASSLSEALGVAAANPDIDIALLDLFLPDEGGMQAGFSGIAAFGLTYPQLPIVILSSSEDPRDVRRALACGALGYVPKSASPDTLKAALELVLKGEIYVPLLMLGDPTGIPVAGPQGASAVRLTGRQIEVLSLIVVGHSNKEIARTLNVSDKTVKAHVTGIFKAFGVTNRTQAAGLARTLGMV